MPLNKKGGVKMLLKNKNVLVVGMARSGVSTVKTLSKLGANITINDIKNKDSLKDILDEIGHLCSECILGTHPQDLNQFDLIVLSPGVPTDLEFIKKAKSVNIPLIGELELAYKLSKGNFIAITGTNGKTTTTALTGMIFKNANIETFIVGNIGTAAISRALQTTDKSILVTEVSSFQLETIVDFKPKISAILNITPDHLNRHKTMKNYINSKANIFKNQKENDILVLNYDNNITKDIAKRAVCKVLFFSREERLREGIFVKNDSIIAKTCDVEEEICHVKDIYIPGKHNLENALAATAIAYSFGIDKRHIKNTLRTFKGVEHRIEFVDEINSVKFYNDSKGTNPDASIKAIEAIKAPIILIAGGMDKGSNFDEFINAFNGKVKALVLLGETAEKIKMTAEEKSFKNIFIVSNMEQAVIKSFEISDAFDNILLSPACASWDMYENFEHRGKHFKECVYKLRRS
ncbi:MAG: UDP-N-acetylmuramoylalanine--D-glutamate ligase [Candidatus Petromonas sp.]|jgi:UDP-N-acetylmuramoylalanine--D-glutamate ligase|nr:UDP-N-acetylmuramoylalanine--D-glutamate ligase [Candidatus Petromonas sp.]